MSPTLRAVALFALGLPVALLPALVDARLWTLWLAFVVVAVVVTAADAALGLPRRRLAVAVDVPGTLYIGEADPMEVRLSAAGWPRAMHAELLTELGERLVPQPLRRVRVPPGQPGATHVRLAPRRRGTARIHAVWIRWRGPLGLVERSVRHALDREVAVVPNIRAVRSAAIQLHTHHTLPGLKAQRFVGAGSEFDALTEYRRGLDPRAMDWKASARHRKLVCREFRAERNHQVVLAFDTGHLMGEPVEGVPKLDHAINSGLLLAYYSLRAGDRVGLLAFDDQVRRYIEPRGGVRAIHALQQRISDIEYGEAETNFTLGLTHLVGRLKRRSLVVVLTDFVDTVTAELMVDNIGRLSRRHVVVFVSLADPTLHAETRARPVDLHAMHRAVVAEDLLQERRRVVVGLQRRGVFCIDAPPGGVSSQLINRYLEIKRRELV